MPTSKRSGTAHNDQPERSSSALPLPKLLDALDQQWCNGCHAPRKTWGPICGGMTQGDYTHYHTPEFWWARFHRLNPMEAVDV